MRYSIFLTGFADTSKLNQLMALLHIFKTLFYVGFVVYSLSLRQVLYSGRLNCLMLMLMGTAGGIGHGQISYWYGQCIHPSSPQWSLGFSVACLRISLFWTSLDKQLFLQILSCNSLLLIETVRPIVWSTREPLLLCGKILHYYYHHHHHLTLVFRMLLYNYGLVLWESL